MVDARHFVLPYVIWEQQPKKLRCGCVDDRDGVRTFCKWHMPHGQCGNCGIWTIYAPVSSENGILKCVDKNECYRRSYMKMWAKEK